MLGFGLTKTAAGDCVWAPLGGPIIALEAARAARAAAELLIASSPTAAIDEKAVPPPTTTPPAPSPSPPPTLELADLFPPTPPPSLLSPELQRAHTTAFRRLHDRVKQAGLYRPPDFFVGYGQDLVRYACLFLTFAVCLWKGTHAEQGTWGRTGWLAGSTTGLGLLWQYVPSELRARGFPRP